MQMIKREKYKQLGFKLTPQRLAILDYLEGNKNHPSAEDVYREVSRRFPTMSLATVYNTLDALRRRGEVSELTIDPIKKRFDASIEPHHHLICLLCKRIVDIHRDFALHLSAADAEHFQLVGNHIVFYGICPHCKDKSSKKMRHRNTQTTLALREEQDRATPSTLAVARALR